MREACENGNVAYFHTACKVKQLCFKGVTTKAPVNDY